MGNLFALGVNLGARGDDTVRLTLDERDLLVSLDDNMASLTSGLGADNALNRHNLSGERSLGGESVHGKTNVLQLQGHIGALDLQCMEQKIENLKS